MLVQLYNMYYISGQSCPIYYFTVVDSIKRTEADAESICAEARVQIMYSSLMIGRKKATGSNQFTLCGGVLKSPNNLELAK